ncbi:MAG: ArsA-related P-loop ATPase [Oscillospiraceae bacterium]
MAGKGGVGKTSLSAAFVRLLTETHPDARILAIDADPAVGLSTALGVEVRQTLDDIRKQIVSSVEDGEPREAIELAPARPGTASSTPWWSSRNSPSWPSAGRRPPGATARSTPTSRRSSIFWPVTSTMWSSTARPALNRSTAASWRRSPIWCW